jgi:antitoxin ChpS
MSAGTEFVTLRRAGGSLTLTIPKSLAKALGLSAGAKVGVSLEGGRIIAEPAGRRPQYTLEELLAQSDPEAPLSAEDEAWLTGPSAGSELI